jgi:hypothetical protein
MIVEGKGLLHIAVVQQRIVVDGAELSGGGGGHRTLQLFHSVL